MSYKSDNRPSPPRPPHRSASRNLTRREWKLKLDVSREFDLHKQGEARVSFLTHTIKLKGFGKVTVSSFL
ncbi:hypothetical protein R69749_05606 [Paraburkholderia domus]|uniref:Uncharacterized protein n=1 Tax=Paraburkholderia domus TaxID=2793075 RepID=A0A9N8R2V6_9BURK|nr:hypothetical protein R70006_01574 [Paraburkholderia domus]CAE6863677.1 hypothetical protein R69749_05606 [Paraburkholderia domus]CAE6869332.1 hypothetical protein R70199_01483 [Paraburkholderia domus]CAE6877478.1 hypothetical protein R75471_01571 [Paraburkholderia domus]CAE6941922.1 hypothetical protein R70211_05746 [Paraburkholderia domus]